MDLLYNLVFYVIGLIFGLVIMYSRAYYKYKNKDNIDKAYKERKEYHELNQILEQENKEQKEKIKSLNKEIEINKREIMEKNKYLSEDKVILERLSEVKKRINKINETLEPYDKGVIDRLIKESRKSKELLINHMDDLDDENDDIYEENQKKR